MKTIKIFALPSHQTKDRTSGVDFARIIQPMKALDGYKDEEVEFKVTLFDIEKTTDWKDVSENYDIIYFNYLNSPWGYAAMGAMARPKGVKIVLDLDDSLWNIKSDNPAHIAYKRGSEALHNFTCICNDVDYMTTTSSYLKHVIMNNTTKKPDTIKVFPNYVDLNLYDHVSTFKDNGQIQLLHFGSTTHFNDLLENEFVKGVDRIMKEFPHVSIKFVGAFIPALRAKWGMRYQNAFGHQDIYQWIKGPFRTFMDESDILVVPLTDDIYNRAKSNIKFLEASSAKKPGVYQRIRQYADTIEEGKNGFLASKSSEWYTSLKQLIENTELRKNMGEAAYTTVKDHHQIHNHVKEYAEFFKSIVQ